MPTPKTKPFPRRFGRQVLLIRICAFLLVSVGLGLLSSSSLALQTNPRDENPDYQAYEAALKNWKKTFREVHETRFQFDNCSEAESDVLRTRYRELKTTGDEQAYEAIDLGAKAFASLDNLDADLLELLSPLPKKFYESSMYDRAQRIGYSVLSKKQHDHEIAFITIHSAYCSNNFEVANELLLQWQEDHGEVPPGLKDLFTHTKRLVGEWEKELKIQAREAKEDKLPRLRFDTDKGPVVVELFQENAPVIVHNMMFSAGQTETFKNLSFFRSLKHQFAITGCLLNDGTKILRMGMMTPEVESRKRFPFRGTVSLELNNGGAFTAIRFNRVPMPDYEDDTLVIGRVISGMDAVDKLAETHTVNQSQALVPVTSVEPDRLISMLIERAQDGETYDSFIEEKE